MRKAENRKEKERRLLERLERVAMTRKRPCGI
jgi:hypothetical protein